MNLAYVQYGEWGGPYRTIQADGLAIDDTCRPNPYAMGYGHKIPTQYRVLHRGRWRRVYCACYGNSGSTYIIEQGVDVVVDIYLSEQHKGEDL
jgi:hypothetical protein